MTLETMTKISTVTVGAGTDSSITFSNIPQTYTDLIVKVSGHLTGTGFGESTIKLTFNSSTSGYSWRSVLTDASGSYSQKGDSVAFIEAGILPASQLAATTNVFGVLDMLISNYASNNSKAVSVDYAEERSSLDNYIGFVSGIWVNTAPITSLTITPNSSNFSQYSTFTLYGVKSMRAASGNSIKATGGSVKFDGTYVTHTFNTSGSFTPTTNLLVDYLVVAGGGSGGTYAGGGGGAGGFKTSLGGSRLSLTGNAGYTVTVGAGGAASSGFGNNGSNSAFSIITSTGGGGGAGNTGGTVGGSGGSGGGGTGTTAVAAGGAGTAGEGNNGGSSGGGSGGGGGGGGAGAVGANATPGGGNGGDGGVGLTSLISGSSVYYAGGGGGAGTSGGSGSGGLGGGGKGNVYQGVNAVAGTVNTGGGGGGDWVGLTGAAGGSGIVIIRYKG